MTGSRIRPLLRQSPVPIFNTAYATPLKPTDDYPPYLVYDRVDAKTLPSRATARSIVRDILTKKYGKACPAGYIDIQNCRSILFSKHNAYYMIIISACCA